MKTKIYILTLLALCINVSLWAAEGGTLTSNVTPIDPSQDVVLTYNGIGTNFAKWNPKCYVHVWCLDAAGTQLYTTSWSTCNGDGDYNNLDAKLKMTQQSQGIYTITLNIQSFFGVPSNQLGNIAKLGIIVRAQYDGDNNKTNNFLLDVAMPACTEPVITASTTSFSAETGKNLTLSGISVTPSCSYQWTATGGTLGNATTLTPTFTAASAGTYTLTLTATNGDCTATKAFTVTVTAASTTNTGYYLRSSFINWNPGTEFIKKDASSSIGYVTHNFTSTGNQTLKVYGNNKWNGLDNGKITRVNNKITLGNGSGGDVTLDVSIVGEYVFAYNTVTRELTVTYPAIVTYTVTFNANGHGTAPSAQTVNSGDKATRPTDPTASGYTFGGWYTNAECTGTAYDFNTAVTSNLTLYARWTATVVPNSCYALHAEFLNWSNAMKFTESEDGKTASCTYIVSEAQSSEKSFGLRELKSCDNTNDQAEWWYATNNTVITQTTTIQLYKKITPNCSNPKILLDRVGSYVFTLEYSTMKLTVTYPAAPDPYPVSFGVIDNQGGTLTAKSDNRTIKSGDAVTSATFTAVPVQGYTIEGWYSDIDATSRIEEAGTASTYTMTVTEDNNDVYVKFRQVDAVYFKKNDLEWGNVYVYTFSANPWDDGKGVHPQRNRLEFGQMTQVQGDIYTKQLANTSLVFVTFSKDNQSGYNDLYDTEAVHRGDFNSVMPLFVPERGSSAEETNSVKYYNSGIWMKYNSTSSGYSLMYRDAAGNEKAYPFTAATAGGFTFKTVVPTQAGKTYTLYVKNEKGEYFSVGNNATLVGNEEAFRLYSWDDWDASAAYVTFTPAASGNYTVYLYLEDGKVVIGFGEEPGQVYRLVYVERTGDSKTVFHPSHYINTHSRATAENPINDTISLHVRPMLKNTDGDEYENPQTCEVWFQCEDTAHPGNWITIHTVNVKTDAAIAGNGVYNFVIEQRGGEDVSVSDIHPYTGTFYIRSDAAKLATGDVKGVAFDDLNYVGNIGNRLLYSEYAHNNEAFDYYYCQWTTKGTNVKFTVANLYSYCIADTLVQNTYENVHNFVGTDGKLVKNANMRFMWNSYDNTLDRAYLAGAGDNVQLLSRGGVYDLEGNEKYTISLKDKQNWVYSADVLVNANALVKIYAPYEDIQQYFKGAAGDYNKPNVYPLITGKSEHQYKIRIIYDFKTNHLICAWLVGGLEITEDDEISTDLMILRRNNESAEQLTFNPNAREIAKVRNAYCVLSITKAYLESNISSKQKSMYWVTFPFDVLLSEVFGGGMEYGNDYMIQYYDGAARAANGCWSDSPTYWKYYEERGDIRLNKGHGYVVVIDWQRIIERFFYAGNTEVALYFPSANTKPMAINGEIEEVTIPEHPCNIKRDNRYIYDSNWNLIGAPSFANVDEFDNPMQAKMVGDYQVGFLYEYDFATNRFNVSAAETVDIKSMYSYMVQFAGVVNWMEKKYNGTVVPEALQARRALAENDVRTLCLMLERNGNICDRTYVRLQDGDATDEFDLNIDLTKIDNAGAGIYTLTAGDAIRVAANVLPVPAAKKQIPVGVSLMEAGEYTFALPDGTEGMSVVFFDTETGIRTNLLLGSYTVTLAKGTYEQRFVLEVNPQQQVITASDNIGTEDNAIRKYLIEGNLYIRTADRLYDVQGRQVRAW